MGSHEIVRVALQVAAEMSHAEAHGGDTSGNGCERLSMFVNAISDQCDYE